MQRPPYKVPKVCIPAEDQSVSAGSSLGGSNVDRGISFKVGLKMPFA